jgi:DNA-binding NtrC family response regulator
MRVGGNVKISVDARVVCATLRPLEDEVRAGRFRADLFYRLQGISLRVPSLRDRRADISPLVQELTAQLSSKHGTKPPKYTRAATSALRSYEWPGNVRELRNVVELVCLLREGRPVRVRDLPPALAHAAAADATPSRALVRDARGPTRSATRGHGLGDPPGRARSRGREPLARCATSRREPPHDAALRSAGSGRAATALRPRRKPREVSGFIETTSTCPAPTCREPWRSRPRSSLHTRVAARHDVMTP